MSRAILTHSWCCGSVEVLLHVACCMLHCLCYVLQCYVLHCLCYVLHCLCCAVFALHAGGDAAR